MDITSLINDEDLSRIMQNSCMTNISTLANQIEENLKQVPAPSNGKHIDLSIIEKLKQRRGPQRMRCEELEAKRDAIIERI